MRIDTSVPAIPHLLRARVDATPWTVALEAREGERWRTWTWAEVAAEVRELSAGLLASGLEPGQTVALLSGTRREWVVADLAVLCAGLATTAIYPTTTPEECSYILKDSGARALFVEDGGAWARFGRPSGLALGVAFDGAAEGALSLDGLRARGRSWLAERGPGAWEAVGRAVRGSDLATLIYTSGTTGPPKGVPIAHDAWMTQARALAPVVDALRTPDDKLYVWLPLAHAYGKVLELASVAYGVPAAIDGDLDRLARSLVERRPTWVPAVPRVFEKMRERMRARAAERGPRAAAVFARAERVAVEVSRLRRDGRPVPWALAARHALCERLVYRRIREGLGGRVRGFLSGSAPLSDELQHFFDGCGLPIYEGYGMTETAALATANRPGDVRFGSVGRPAPGMEVRIAPDGEILLRGPAVLKGYHRRPDADAVALRDGWLHTGDLGRIDAEGYLYVTGRIKELIVTSGGKKVAPLPIEAAIKARCPLIQEVVTVGDERRFCSALVALDPDAAPAWARARGLPDDLPSLAAHPAVRAELQVAFDDVNAALPSWSTLKGFAVVDRAFTIEGGELTPSQKVRRREVIARYGALLDPLYA